MATKQAASQQVQFFPNIQTTIATQTIPVDEALDTMRGDSWKLPMQEIRACRPGDNSPEAKAERTTLKKELPYYSFGGTFEKRSNQNLTVHSGLVNGDLDTIQNLETAAPPFRRGA